MGSQRSKEDEVFKISTSVFVTNFPDQFNAKELRNTCKQYGFVVDAFIPTRRPKAGKRFGFVRFINVFDAERLVNNLCTIWIGSQRSKEDEVFKISTSVFVTNFPDQFNAKELWNTYKKYGFVADAFIPTRRSKAGKRFGFVRFINVFDAERLVNNLCTIWIGRYKIHANIAQFQRAPMNNSSSQFKNNEAKRNYTYTDAKGHANSYLHAVKGF
nr:nucleotide-binding alpha-beta plait domain-containing protein [Tanacetum cinerariifolium]